MFALGSNSPDSSARFRSSGVNNDRVGGAFDLKRRKPSCNVGSGKPYFANLLISPSRPTENSISSPSNIDHSCVTPSSEITTLAQVDRRPRTDSFNVGSAVLTWSRWCRRAYSGGIIGDSNAEMRSGDGSVLVMSVISVDKDVVASKSVDVAEVSSATVVNGLWKVRRMIAEAISLCASFPSVANIREMAKAEALL